MIYLDNKHRRIKVAVGNSFIILILREPTTDEYTNFIAVVSHPARKESQHEKVVQKRIAFIDKLLVGVDGEDSEGNKEEIAIQGDGEISLLTAEIEGWKNHIRPSWKLAASFTLEGRFGAEEQDALKN